MKQNRKLRDIPCIWDILYKISVASQTHRETMNYLVKGLGKVNPHLILHQSRL